MHQTGSRSNALVEALAANADLDRILFIERMIEDGSPSVESREKVRVIKDDSPRGAGFAQILDAVETDYVLLFVPGEQVRFGQRAVERFLSVAEDSGAGLIYSDF